jgi:hypothetical protein
MAWAYEMVIQEKALRWPADELGTSEVVSGRGDVTRD